LARSPGIAATVEGLVRAQEAHCAIDADGVAWPGNQELYANMIVQGQRYDELLFALRDLCGGGLIQLPSSAADFANPAIAADIARYVQSPGTSSVEAVKLLKLAWDAIGSEFAGRHLQYEMFYSGPVRYQAHMFRTYDFAGAQALVQAALAGYDSRRPHPPAIQRGLESMITRPICCRCRCAQHRRRSPRRRPDRDPLKVALIPGDIAAQVYYAIDQGFFSKAGLDVAITPITADPRSRLPCLSGAVDVGYSNVVSLAVGHDRGLPLAIIAPANLHLRDVVTAGILTVLQVPHRSAAAKDLDGKIVAVNALNNISDVAVRAWVDANAAMQRR